MLGFATALHLTHMVNLIEKQFKVNNIITNSPLVTSPMIIVCSCLSSNSSFMPYIIGVHEEELFLAFKGSAIVWQDEENPIDI